MTAVIVDIYTDAERVLLEAKWAAAGRDLDDARRHAALLAGALYAHLPVDLIVAFSGRWIIDAFGELERLDLEGELPRGAR